MDQGREGVTLERNPNPCAFLVNYDINQRRLAFAELAPNSERHFIDNGDKIGQPAMRFAHISLTRLRPVVTYIVEVPVPPDM
jgi:hypothetical protein